MQDFLYTFQLFRKKTIHLFHEKVRIDLLDRRAHIIERCSSKEKKKNPCANSSDNDSLGMRRQSDSVCTNVGVLGCLRADGLMSAGCHARGIKLLGASLL